MVSFLVRSRIGFRGVALILYGLIYILIGIGALISPNPTPGLFHTNLPVWLRLIEWAGTGVFAIIVALIVRVHVGAEDKRIDLQAWGFVGLFLGPVLRTISFGYGALVHWNPVWLTGFAVYLLMTLTVILLAAWPEPCTPTKVALEEVDHA